MNVFDWLIKISSTSNFSIDWSKDCSKLKSTNWLKLFFSLSIKNEKLNVVSNFFRTISTSYRSRMLTKKTLKSNSSQKRAIFKTLISTEVRFIWNNKRVSIFDTSVWRKMIDEWKSFLFKNSEYKAIIKLWQSVFFCVVIELIDCFFKCFYCVYDSFEWKINRFKWIASNTNNRKIRWFDEYWMNNCDNNYCLMKFRYQTNNVLMIDLNEITKFSNWKKLFFCQVDIKERWLINKWNQFDYIECDNLSLKIK